MDRPAFQFYVKDWRTNQKLRRCSEAARGAWIDIMCALHGSDEYGVARFPLAELAEVAGVKIKSARELVAKGVLKGGDKDVEPFIHTPTHAGKKLAPVTLLEASKGPLWYSSRMVKDEWLRGRRGESTRFGPDNPPPKKKRHGDEPGHSPTHRQGESQGDGAAVASASAVQSLTGYRVFEEGGSDGPVDNPPEGRAKSKPSTGPRWWSTEEGIIAEGKRRGIQPNRGELMEDYRQRLFQTRDKAA